MFNNFTYEKLDSEEAEDLIEIVNTEASDLSTYLLFHLEVINSTIEELKKDNAKLVQISAINVMLQAVFMAKKLLALIDGRRSSIKITSSEVESIKINAKAIINGIEKVAVLNKEHMLKVDPEELLVYMIL